LLDFYWQKYKRLSFTGADLGSIFPFKNKILIIKQLQQYLPEFVYGSIDGSVTTFAVVAGAAGAGLDSSVVIILGFANLIADGFSMSVGSYLSNQSDQHNYEKHKKREIWEVHYNPEEGREEVRAIFQKKGLEGALLEQVVHAITSDKKIWVDTMMKEELEMLPAAKSPFSMGLSTFISFVLIGLIPLSVYVLDYFNPLTINLFAWSSALTLMAFAIIGILKSYVTERSMIRGVLETILLGVAAAALAYATGYWLERLI